MPSRPSREKESEYSRHKSYLQRLKHTSLFCPRYDMLSTNNNLLLHRNYDPRKDLLPKPLPQALREVELEIRKKKARQAGEAEGREGPKWYEAVLREEGVVGEQRFHVEYCQAGSSGFTIRESLNRLYNTRGRACSRERAKGTTFYAGQTRLD